MAHLNTSAGPSKWPVNGQQGIPDPLIIELAENDLFAIRALFDLLAEWEFKVTMNANLDQS
ncbi:MAG: hypothetical protein C5B58_14395 [Acidobacteria bacterium]|nr:MAG: hypothetical protein C5B58_14395 [Acidobacteriota bacterium]